MAEDLSRAEYPAMLTHLQPLQAVQALEQRHKRIAKLNIEIADWLQERRKVEDQYIQSLRKLTLFKVPNAVNSELGIFGEPWRKILEATSTIAASHQMFVDHVEKDVEMPLRTFQNKREYLNMANIHGHLLSMAKELDDAQHGVDKVTKKGGKASVQKAELATTKLESASQQWESQAPYVFEQLQALDEQRLNHLRDILTQYQTLEGDQGQRMQANAESVLNAILELNTAEEIQAFAARAIQGKPKLEKRSSTRASNNLGASTSLAPPTQTSSHDDDRSDHSGGRNESHGESSRLRSRIGTMLGRRRQSVHGGFGPISPIKGSSSLSRGLSSSHGRLSPRASQNNLAETSTNRLSSLVESPDSPNRPTDPAAKEKTIHEGTNGTAPGWTDGPAEAGPSTNGAQDEAAALFDFQPPPGPPPAKDKAPEAAKQDAEGFTIPPPGNDPITLAQKEAAAESSEQPFKLNIQKQPVGEEDVDANKAAMSNMANTLAQLAAPSRKTGTVRGRRDVRNTIYMPSSVPEGSATTSDPSSAFPPPSPTPAMPAMPTPPPGLLSKPTAVSALQSEGSMAGTSDTQSIRSSTSLGGFGQPKHPDMLGPGLNASIIETVVASFERGEVKSVKVNGEIAFSYNFSATAGSDNKETIRINNFTSLESIGPNRIFVQNASSLERADEFVLDVSHISRTSVGFTYRVHSDDSNTSIPPPLASRVPLLLRTAWKPVGDKLGLVLEYALNPALAGLSGDASSSASSLPFHNLFLVATYEGRASAAQTRPPSTHLREKHMVYWRVADAAGAPLVPGEWHKMVCRITAVPSPAGEPAPELKPGRVEARWEYVPPAAFADGEGVISVSRLEEGAAEGKGKEKATDVDEADPFADEQLSPMPSTDTTRGKWVEVPLQRKVVSGKYEAV